MKQIFLLIMAVGLFSMNVFSEDQEPVWVMKVKVLKNNVNMRAKPDKTSEVVGQISENDELVVKSMGVEWVEIVPPPLVDFWMLADYIHEGVVKGEKVNVRTGPGINFSIAGQLSRGTAVTVRGSHAQWVSIAPPEICSLWINKALVEVVADETLVSMYTGEQGKDEQLTTDKSMKIKPLIQVESASVSVVLTSESDMAERTDDTTLSIKPPPDLDLIPSPGQGQWKQFEGVLRPRTQFFRVPSKYRLVVYDQDKNAITICYVKGNNAQLKALLNRSMVISGREYWVCRARYPVLVPERIVLKGK